jgi:hypothetical protein
MKVILSLIIRLLRQSGNKIVAVFGFIVLLASCASVDQYGSRIYDGNINSQNAMNQETLLNIVRASRYQSPNFIGISQVTGSQTNQWTAGLPAVFIGPGQTPAEHVYSLTNSLQAMVNGAYQSNPLISTAFTSGMLAPVSPRTIALLSSVRPREVVFFLVTDQIEVTLPNEKIVLLQNDPSSPLNNPPPGKSCNDIMSQPPYINRLYPDTSCNYTKFAHLLDDLLGNGYTAELVENTGSSAAAPPSSAAGGGSSTSGSSSSNAGSSGLPGQLCFDPALAGEGYRQQSAVEFPTRCDAPARPAQAGGGTTKTTGTSVKTTAGKTETTITNSTTGTADANTKAKSYQIQYPMSPTTFAPITVRLFFRSPIGVLNYLGLFLNDNDSDIFAGYQQKSAKAILNGERYLNVTNSPLELCYTSLLYAGQLYCVPASSRHTPMIMDLFEDLRNLSIQPSDLNAAFTVRVTP